MHSFETVNGQVRAFRQLMYLVGAAIDEKEYASHMENEKDGVEFTAGFLYDTKAVIVGLMDGAKSDPGEPKKRGRPRKSKKDEEEEKVAKKAKNEKDKKEKQVAVEAADEAGKEAAADTNAARKLQLRKAKSAAAASDNDDDGEESEEDEEEETEDDEEEDEEEEEDGPTATGDGKDKLDVGSFVFTKNLQSCVWNHAAGEVLMVGERVEVLMIPCKTSINVKPDNLVKVSLEEVMKAWKMDMDVKGTKCMVQGTRQNCRLPLMIAKMNKKRSAVCLYRLASRLGTRSIWPCAS